jgi:hypothetical protein
VVLVCHDIPWMVLVCHGISWMVLELKPPRNVMTN